ncbi:MAG: ribbon-helix-helix domain-containing protein [Alphaproteobacteria bacterium]|nr:ribbon-helix-helix domain-containing protein [Alphaproteobacteria bacterium]
MAPVGAIKRSVLIAGHRTSVSLEPEFWDALKQIAESASRSINGLITDIDRDRTTNLSSALRVYVLKMQSRDER